MILKHWVTKSLHRGDLKALSGLAQGNQPPSEKIGRLVFRKFATVTSNGSPRVTGRGRIALLLRNISRSR